MNSMSLLRNSVIVGGATFLVGSALMEVSKGNEKVGWWPYTATFLSGALGFYLLRQQFVPVPEALELNSERIHGDERLDRWVESHYGDEYELLEDSSLFEDYDPYDILEDFIVLDDDGNHKDSSLYTVKNMMPNTISKTKPSRLLLLIMKMMRMRNSH